MLRLPSWEGWGWVIFVESARVRFSDSPFEEPVLSGAKEGKGDVF